jgi:hypothetical protein
LHDPNLQVAGIMIRMELGQANEVMVFIALKLLHQVTVPNGRASEVLRQLALVYFHDPNSQVAGIRMQPGRADGLGVMVVIALRLTNL